LERHLVLLSASYAKSDIDDAYDDLSGLRVSDIDRKNFSIGLQDQMALTERFSITFGIRFDDYDDVGSHLTPRLAAVYRLGEHHVVKAQYSEGFRAPTFWELYRTGSADESLDFEAMDMAEVSYIYRRPDIVGRVTLYYSEIDDGIFRKVDGSFENMTETNSKGVEVEWEQRLGEKFRWQANLSYNDTRDGRFAENGYNSPGIAPWLGNLILFIQPTSRLVLTGRLHHVGDRYATNIGAWVEGYDTVDLTVSRMDFWKTGITLRGGVKNVLDDTVTYLTNRPSALSEDEYRGRTWWLQVSYDF